MISSGHVPTSIKFSGIQPVTPRSKQRGRPEETNTLAFYLAPERWSGPLDSHSHWQIIGKRRVYGRSLWEVDVSMSNSETSLDQLFRKITATSSDKASRDRQET